MCGNRRHTLLSVILVKVGIFDLSPQAPALEVLTEATYWTGFTVP